MKATTREPTHPASRGSPIAAVLVAATTIPPRRDRRPLPAPFTIMWLPIMVVASRTLGSPPVYAPLRTAGTHLEREGDVLPQVDLKGGCRDWRSTQWREASEWGAPLTISDPFERWVASTSRLLRSRTCPPLSNVTALQARDSWTRKTWATY